MMHPMIAGQALVLEQLPPGWGEARRTILVRTPDDRRRMDRGATSRSWQLRQPPHALSEVLGGAVTAGPYVVDVTVKEYGELRALKMPRSLAARAGKALSAAGPVDTDGLAEWWADPAARTVATSAAGRARLPREQKPATPPAPAPPSGRRTVGYLSRKIGRTADVDALRKYRDTGGSVLAFGPAGTGKTELMIAAFGDEMRTISCHEDTVAGDFVGEYVKMPDGSWKWFDHDLPVCMEEGLVLFVDDINRARMKQLAVLFPVMDGRRSITVTAAGERRTVTAAPGFTVVAGANLRTAGTDIDPALASRFDLKLEILSDYKMAERLLGVDPVLVNAAQNLETRRLAGEVGWAPQMRDLLRAMANVERLGMAEAMGSIINSAPAKDRDTVAEVFSKALGKRVRGLALR